MGLPSEVIERERFVDVTCGICGEAANRDSSRCSSEVHVCAEKTTQPIFFGNRIKRIMAIPMRHQGKLLGVYNLFMGEEEFVPEELALLFNSISEQLGLALENARLTRENLRVTLMNERQLLASQIHDSIAQTLAYAKMRLSLLSEAMDARDCDQAELYFNDLRDAMDEAYTSLRALLANFRNPMDARGLMPALQEMMANFRQKHKIELEFESDIPDLGLTPEQEVQVFHIVQEGLSNIAKHSRATRAKVSLRFAKDDYHVTVEDNGVGALADYKPGTTHFGLNIMRERAQRLGGHIHLYQGAGSGTRIDLTFPALLCRQQERG
jgi:two-component system nitrate/nitrite sensor histidine kinase NarX